MLEVQLPIFSIIQIDLGAMRFPDIDVMERVGATPTTTGANPKPKPWSLVGKV